MNLENNLIQAIEQNYAKYLSLLKRLVAINTVYTNQKGIKKALLFCKNHFANHLKNYNWYFDQENNLIGICKSIDENKPIVYLSAHIDTVGAEIQDWDKKYNPFIPFEDGTEIVGRGASDCKAGVAYQLFLAQLLSRLSLATNIIFTISSREENGGVSAKEIGLQLGKKLPLGAKAYLITLENNMRVTPSELCIQYGERGAVGIEVICELPTIQRFLQQDINLWNPTNITPVTDVSGIAWEELRQAGGHAGTSTREKNILYKLLMNDNVDHLLLQAGDGKTISQLPAIIKKAITKEHVPHKIIFDLRTYKKLADITGELQQYTFKYRFVKKLDFGYDVKEQLFHDQIYQKMIKIESGGLQLVFELNPGSTDSGCIYNYCPGKLKKKFLPLTMGPGSRSQREKIPLRLSHGVNETYDKQAGLKAILYISQLLLEMGLFNNTKTPRE